MKQYKPSFLINEQVEKIKRSVSPLEKIKAINELKWMAERKKDIKKKEIDYL